MSIYGKANPVKLTGDQEAALESVRSKSGATTSLVLRAAVGYFLKKAETMDRDELLRILADQSSLERAMAPPQKKRGPKPKNEKAAQQTPGGVNPQDPSNSPGSGSSSTLLNKSVASYVALAKVRARRPSPNKRKQ